MRLNLYFAPAISYLDALGDEIIPEIIRLPYLTERIISIFTSIVYPYPILDINHDLGSNETFVQVQVPNPEEGMELVEEATYGDRITPKGLVSGIGQDTWAEGDVTLDNETLELIGFPEDTDVFFIPLLKDYSLQQMFNL